MELKPGEKAPLLHLNDAVRHKRSGRIGKVSRFAHNGTTDVFVDGTGPYPQSDLELLTVQKEA